MTSTGVENQPHVASHSLLRHTSNSTTQYKWPALCAVLTHRPVKAAASPTTLRAQVTIAETSATCQPQRHPRELNQNEVTDSPPGRGPNQTSGPTGAARPPSARPSQQNADPMLLRAHQCTKTLAGARQTGPPGPSGPPAASEWVKNTLCFETQKAPGPHPPSARTARSTVG